jgi:tetratricopeptide (TPR) repeat protein
MKLANVISMAALAVGLCAIADVAPASAQSPLQSLRNSQRGSNQQSDENQNQEQQQQQPQQQQHLQINGVSRGESDAIMPTYQAVQSQDWTAARAALPAAQAAARSSAARYVVGQLELQIARGTNDNALMLHAVNAMIDSGGAPAEQMDALRRVKSELTLNQVSQSDPAAAETQLTQLLAADPDNVQRIIQLAEVKERLNKHDEAIALYQRAIAASATGGHAADQNLYRRALSIAYRAQMGPRSKELARALVTAYPTRQNWRDALLIYRQFSDLDGNAQLDLRRFQRAAHALNGEGDYVMFAEELSRGGLPGEAKAVLDEGVGGGSIQANSANVAPLLARVSGQVAADRAGLAGQRTQAMAASTGRQARATGDAYYGYGQYAEAAELYRAALQKGGEDANLVNLRLGASLAQAGQRAAAEAAFHAVTGPRADIAAFWLLWLAHPPQ